jgi:hypothetical protein
MVLWSSLQNVTSWCYCDKMVIRWDQVDKMGPAGVSVTALWLDVTNSTKGDQLCQYVTFLNHDIRHPIHSSLQYDSNVSNQFNHAPCLSLAPSQLITELFGSCCLTQIVIGCVDFLDHDIGSIPVCSIVSDRNRNFPFRPKPNIWQLQNRIFVTFTYFRPKVNDLLHTNTKIGQIRTTFDYMVSVSPDLSIVTYRQFNSFQNSAKISGEYDNFF